MNRRHNYDAGLHTGVVAYVSNKNTIIRLAFFRITAAANSELT